MVPDTAARWRIPSPWWSNATNLAPLPGTAIEGRVVDTPSSPPISSPGPVRANVRPRPVTGVVRNVPTVDVKLVDVVKQFGDAVVVDHIDLEVRARGVLQPARPVRLRQDDHPADDRRLRGADLGRHRAPGPGRDLAAALQAQRQHGLPELRALPAPDDLRERRLRAAPQGRQGSRGQEPRHRHAHASSSCPASRRASRPRSRVARRSASRWPGP